MHFVWFVVTVVIFQYIYWHWIFIVLTLPSIPAMWLSTFAVENTQQKWIKWFGLTVSYAIGFLFGTLLPVFVYGGVLALTVSHFAENASYPMVYWIIGGIVSFTIMAPSGETTLLGMFLSLASFLLVIFFKVFTGPLGILLQIVLSLLYFVAAIVIFVIICYGVWLICNWLFKKIPPFFVALIRWVLILPVSIAGFYAIIFIVNVTLGSLGNKVPFIFVGILSPMWFVLVGATIAPKHSFIVATCLTILFGISWSVDILSTIAESEVSISEQLWSITFLLLLPIAAAIGACCLFYVISRNNKKVLSEACD